MVINHLKPLINLIGKHFQKSSSTIYQLNLNRYEKALHFFAVVCARHHGIC